MRQQSNRKYYFLRPVLVMCFVIFSCWLVIPVVFADPSCALKMGWEPWKPYQYIDKNKLLTGLDIEIIGMVVKNMGCELQLKNSPWKRLLLQTENGKMDIVAGATMTEERKKWAYFTQAYREETRVLFVLKGTSERYRFDSLI